MLLASFTSFHPPLPWRKAGPEHVVKVPPATIPAWSQALVSRVRSGTPAVEFPVAFQGNTKPLGLVPGTGVLQAQQSSGHVEGC